MKRITAATVLALCLITACVLTGCDESDDADKDVFVRGMWKLKSVETVYVAKDYEDGFGEVSVRCLSEDDTHIMKYKYTPDKDDPSDGPTPYSATFYCTVDIPKELEPLVDYDVKIEAKVESDGNPGHTSGICCYFGIKDTDLYDIYDKGEGTFIKSSGKYNYSYKDSLYPIYAGSPVGYGHMEDPYAESMTDIMIISVPYLKKEDKEKQGDEPFVIKFSFCSNAAETVFTYEFIPKE